MKNELKNTGGRPSKLTETVIAKLEGLLETEENILFLTDQELFEELNDGLNEKERVSYTSFKDWKAGREQKESLLYERFSSLIKKALRKQKRNLFEKMMNGKEAQWQKYAWIIERKFSEWNMRKIMKFETEEEPLKISLVDYSSMSTRELQEIIGNA
ncbi:MAG: hypothetical protein WCJ84_04410 [Candidatus Peregrinibacteria bacterium]